MESVTRSSGAVIERAAERDRARARFESEALPLMSGMYSTALGFTRNAADAEDLVQETFLRAFRGFDRFDPDSNLKAWLYTIMRNAFINTYRKKQREPDTVATGDVEDWYLYAKLSEGGVAPSAENTVLEELPDEDVRKALLSLPEGSRAVVLLADVEGFSYAEIAEILGIPAGTVVSRLHRARKALEKRLWDVVQERGHVRD